MFIHDTAVSSKIVVEGVNISHNRYGGFVNMLGGNNLLSIMSSRFAHSGNGALLIQLGTNNNSVNLYNTIFADNIGRADILGTALHISGGIFSLINILLCDFNGNIGGNSIVYVDKTYFPLLY